jgi:hypothetical protein
VVTPPKNNLNQLGALLLKEQVTDPYEEAMIQLGRELLEEQLPPPTAAVQPHARRVSDNQAQGGSRQQRVPVLPPGAPPPPPTPSGQSPPASARTRRRRTTSRQCRGCSPTKQAKFGPKSQQPPTELPGGLTDLRQILSASRQQQPWNSDGPNEQQGKLQQQQPLLQPTQQPGSSPVWTSPRNSERNDEKASIRGSNPFSPLRPVNNITVNPTTTITNLPNNMQQGIQTVLLLGVLLLAGGVRITEANTATNNTNNITTNHTNDILFSHVGEMLPVYTTVHIIIEQDYSPLFQHCELLKKGPANESTDANRLTEAKRLHRALKRNIAAVCGEVDQLSAFPVNSSHRKPRQLGLVFAGFSTGFSIYNQVQIRQLEAKVRATTGDLHQLQGVIRQETHQLQAVTAQLRDQGQELRDLHDIVEQNMREDYRLNWVRDRITHVQEFALQVQRATNGQQALRMGHLSTDVVTKDTAREIMAKVNHEAKLLDGRPIINHHEDLYRLPLTTITKTSFKWQVQLHVGIARDEFKLLRYRPSPVTIERDGHHVTLLPAPTKKIYAHAGDLHQELDADDLTDCLKLGNTYVCHDILAFHTRPGATCLGSLYSGNVPKIQQHCSLKQTNISWTAESLGPNLLSVYFSRPTTVKTSCPVHNRPNLILSGRSTIKLEANCSLSGDDFRLTSRTDVLSRIPVSTNFAGSTDALLLDYTPEQVSDARERLQRHLLQPVEDVTHMMLTDRHLQVELQNEGRRGQMEIVWYLFFAAHVCVLMVLLVRCVVLYRRRAHLFG